MMKLELPGETRCGEVFYKGPASYEVNCLFCSQKLKYSNFLNHVRLKHLKDLEDKDVRLRKRKLPQEKESESEELCKRELRPKSLRHQAKASPSPIPSNNSNNDDDDDDDNKEEKIEFMDTTPKDSRKVHAVNKLDEKELQNASLDALLDMDWTAYASEEELADVEEQDQESEKVDDLEDDAKDMLFPCDKCDRAYVSKRSLQSHKRHKHSDKPKILPQKPAMTIDGHRKKAKPAPKVFQCDKPGCSETFRNERDLRAHHWKHTGMVCDICGKPFTQIGNMLRHRERHSGIKSHKCQEPDCEASFYTKKELNSHKICHTGRMPCICEICGRPCRDRGVLTAHMRRHTGERPAKCEICNKAFYSFHDLNVHAVSHTNLRPFVCDICGSTFQRKKALRVHKLLHSGQRKYPCKLCQKSFAQSGGLHAHMRTHDSGSRPTKAMPVPAATEIPTTTTIASVPVTVPVPALETTLEIDHISQEEHEEAITVIEIIEEPATGITMAINIDDSAELDAATWTVA
ncbi:uncharacterized protein Dwil_GK19960 [Drosophila willistoni]|uniref:C2H2-type domain-containing protein n=1 Tax=Drosophila willistoni TaxID=7260 RepID=B4MSE9_DROWI|nr:zinc finger protein 675 [Drosophila willistoni]EDW75038.1 uncharacterized protein Dwil_GK19960 [Drosophila willistoni]